MRERNCPEYQGLQHVRMGKQLRIISLCGSNALKIDSSTTCRDSVNTGERVGRWVVFAFYVAEINRELGNESKLSYLSGAVGGVVAMESIR